MRYYCGLVIEQSLNSNLYRVMCIILEQVKFPEQIWAKPFITDIVILLLYSVQWVGGQSVTKSSAFPPCIRTYY